MDHAVPPSRGGSDHPRGVTPLGRGSAAPLPLRQGRKALTSRDNLTYPSAGNESEWYDVAGPSYNLQRLSDISTPCGTDVTLRNLLESTKTRLELCGRLA